MHGQRIKKPFSYPIWNPTHSIWRKILILSL